MARAAKLRTPNPLSNQHSRAAIARIKVYLFRVRALRAKTLALSLSLRERCNFLSSSDDGYPCAAREKRANRAGPNLGPTRRGLGSVSHLLANRASVTHKSEFARALDFESVCAQEEVLKTAAGHTKPRYSPPAGTGRLVRKRAGLTAERESIAASGWLRAGNGLQQCVRAAQRKNKTEKGGRRIGGRSVATRQTKNV